MKNLMSKTAKLLIALSITSMFMVSCSEDNVEPSFSRPEKLKVPQ